MKLSTNLYKNQTLLNPIKLYQNPEKPPGDLAFKASLSSVFLASPRSGLDFRGWGSGFRV